jgi:hypothetical protein
LYAAGELVVMAVESVTESTDGPAGEAGGEESPPLPSDLVGEKDDKFGPQGDRVNAGPLAEGNGGTGDAAADFETLTGGNSGEAGPKYPPGSLIGKNDVVLRPERGNSGPRIDIPANGAKPHETLHYPKPK